MKFKKPILFLSLIGLAISLYLTYAKYSSFGCGIGDCDVVQSSKYSEIFGIPVALLGVFYYLFFFIIAYYDIERIPLLPAMNRPVLWLSAFGLLFTAYLTYLELFIIKAICPLCVGSDLVVLLLFILIIFPKSN